MLERSTAFYQSQLHRHAEAADYLARRGLRDPDLMRQLRIGYAPGGNLRRHLTGLSYSRDLLLQAGLINDHGCDAFCRRVMFPCSEQGRVINLYGRSLGAAFPHRFLPRTRGGLFAWEAVRCRWRRKRGPLWRAEKDQRRGYAMANLEGHSGL